MRGLTSCYYSFSLLFSVFYWYLYLDGTITLEIKLTGELSTNCLSPGEANPEHGTLVDPFVSNPLYWLSPPSFSHFDVFCKYMDVM